MTNKICNQLKPLLQAIRNIDRQMESTNEQRKFWQTNANALDESIELLITDQNACTETTNKLQEILNRIQHHIHYYIEAPTLTLIGDKKMKWLEVEQIINTKQRKHKNGKMDSKANEEPNQSDSGDVHRVHGSWKTFRPYRDMPKQ